MLRPRVVAPFIFASGACSLVYQTAWLRELKLVFGASTAASAAVLAIFIGGLGAGGLVLGPRADRHRRPFLLYAQLEAAIAATAALSPLSIALVRALYVGVGGTVSLGVAAGSVLRLLLSALVIGVPTFFMGGTLSAVARAVETDDDHGRRDVAFLYGINTLGAVAGCLAGTFLMFEVFGTRRTLWIACLANALVAVLARSRAVAAPEQATPTPRERSGDQAPAPIWAVCLAAGVAGFVFFLMELVWYRMLGPILGGTVFTFGLILAVALLGIGLGALAYALMHRGRPATLTGFAYVCLAEAVCMAVPYALGDRIAFGALLLRGLGTLGFWGHVAAWTVVTAMVVLPAAFASGVQFPQLIALAGRGQANVGQHVGLVYGANTVGAIAGSLAGGFGLLPVLTAPGCWRLCAWTLLALAAVGAALAVREGQSGRRRPALTLLGAALLLAALSCADGPTAAWRHGSIGVGRIPPDAARSPNSLRNWAEGHRRSLRWDAEGVESSVGLVAVSGLAFVVNGKVDGNARNDAPTQVMSGLLGALLHPDPRRAMVIGLGTGSTAGWLGVVPSIEKVDVVELEPAVLRVARDCAAVNQNVLDNPRVNIRSGDAREVLLTTRERYDIIFSEPSNPYRAGIASLFTQDFYRAVAARMQPGGLFLQWMQAYEIDGLTLRGVYASLASVFPSIEIWRTKRRDLLFVAGGPRPPYSLSRLRARILEELVRGWCAW
jgi:spermidine synthase